MRFWPFARKKKPCSTNGRWCDVLVQLVGKELETGETNHELRAKFEAETCKLFKIEDHE